MVLDGVASQWAPVTPSVPQGSLLGPLLFTIFINDLLGETVGEVRAALYADDTKLYKNVSSVSDCLSLQTTLANLNDWSKGNNINFNTSKCKTLTVTQKKTPPDLRIHPEQQTKLVRVSAEKDLGVTITCTLSWHSHIHTITAKANKLPRFLKQTCSLLIGVSTRRTLYLSLVKSTLLRY